MKVLHVNDYPIEGVIGGAEVLIQHTVSLLRERGCEVDLFTSTDVPGHRRTAIGYVDNRRARAALRQRVARDQPDVIHLHNFYHELSPAILGELARLKQRLRFAIVMTAHDAHLACPNPGLNFFSRGQRRRVDQQRLGRLGYLLARRWDHRGRLFSALKLAQHIWNYRLHRRRSAIDRVICPSRFMQGIMQEIGLGTAFIPNHIEAPAAPSASRPARLQLVFAGRVEPEKGLAEFLAALPGDFNAAVRIIGEGSDRARCEDVCRSRGLAQRVEFLGSLPRERAREIIASSHVLVLPSLVTENCPMSLLEALACGTSILTGNFGGMREIVEAAGVGFMFDPDDPHSLREALRCIEAEHRAGTLNEFDVRAFLRERTDDAYVENLLALYRDLTAGARLGPAGTRL